MGAGTVLKIPALKIRNDIDRSRWVLIYTTTITILGLLVIFTGLLTLPVDRTGLALFALMAAVAELFNVKLYSSSRSRISVSFIVATASILTIGPSAGALTHAASGLMTALNSTFKNDLSETGRAPRLQRSAFNIGMLVISAALAGRVYVWSGGSVGNIIHGSNVLPLIAAASTDVLVNLIILIGVISIQTGRHPFEIWRQDFQWSMPISIFGGAIGGATLALAYEKFSLLGLAVFFLPVLSIGYSFQLYIRHTKQYVSRLEEMNRTLDETNLGLLETFGAIIDAYDMFTYGHSAQVTIYAEAIAKKMGLPAEVQATIVKAALVHDIGKIGVLDNIIGKQGPLTEDEYNLMKRHPVIGADIIRRMKGLQDLVPLVRHHHERWDGSGYPAGLAGQEIPLGARVITLADSLEAMASDRPYRKTRSFEAIKEEISSCSGTQFDPEVVQAFFAVAEEKGPDFFKNSASSIDRSMLLRGISNIGVNSRYLKKSVVLNQGE